LKLACAGSSPAAGTIFDYPNNAANLLTSYFAPGNAVIDWTLAVPASWRSPGDRELCIDADPAGSSDREPASKITKA
jgi:hypothetical protein